MAKAILKIEQMAQALKVGKWAFLIGILLAIITGFMTIPYITLILVILGLIVGLLNVVAAEVKTFLIAAIALMLVGASGLTAIPAIGVYLEAILKNIIVFVAPAALVIALKAIYVIEKS